MGQAVKAITVLRVLAVLTVGVSASPGATSMLVPTHAIRGVVKSMSATTVVIRPSRKATNEMRFVLSPLTHREGQMTVGATVSVRYRIERDTFVATAVSAHPETP